MFQYLNSWCLTFKKTWHKSSSYDSVNFNNNNKREVSSVMSQINTFLQSTRAICLACFNHRILKMEFVQWHSPWCPTEVLKPNEYLRIYLGSDSSNSFVPAHQPTVWFKEKGERALILFLLFGGVGTEPRVLCMLCKCSTTQLYLSTFPTELCTLSY